MTIDGTELVEDPNDARIAVFLGLRDKVLRQHRESNGGDMAGVFIAEGDVVIARAVDAGYEPVAILIDAARPQALPTAFRACPVYSATPAVLHEIAGFGSYRGALACFHRRPVPSASDVLSNNAHRSFAIVEGVNNPTNLGVMLRSAVGLGIDAMLLTPGSCDPLSRRCCRVSMGEGFRVPYATLPEFTSALPLLEEHGVETWALTPDPTAHNIADLAVVNDQRVGLVLGAEGPGLSDAVLDGATHRVRIDMAEAVDSLNVGAASAIAFYALRQARRPADG